MPKPTMDDIKNDFSDMLANRQGKARPERQKNFEQQGAEAKQDTITRKKIGVQMTPEAHKLLKILCTEKNLKEYEGLAMALNDWFEKNGKNPVA